MGTALTIRGFWHQSSPYQADGVDLTSRPSNTKHESLLVGRLSTSEGGAFPRTLTATIDELYLNSGLLDGGTERIDRVCIYNVFIALSARSGSEALGSSAFELRSDVDVPVSLQHETGAPPEKRDLCISRRELEHDSDQSIRFEEVGWNLQLEFHGTQRAYFNFPFDSLTVVLYANLAYSTYDEQGNRISYINSTYSDEQITVAMPGWVVHDRYEGAALSRPFLEVKALAMGLAILLLLLTLLLWMPQLEDQYLQGVIALLVAFWAVRESLIGGQAVGSLLFDRLFIIGQASILLSLVWFVIKRQNRDVQSTGVLKSN